MQKYWRTDNIKMEINELKKVSYKNHSMENHMKRL